MAAPWTVLRGGRSSVCATVAIAVIPARSGACITTIGASACTTPGWRVHAAVTASAGLLVRRVMTASAAHRYATEVTTHAPAHHRRDSTLAATPDVSRDAVAAGAATASRLLDALTADPRAVHRLAEGARKNLHEFDGRSLANLLGSLALAGPTPAYTELHGGGGDTDEALLVAERPGDGDALQVAEDGDGPHSADGDDFHAADDTESAPDDGDDERQSYVDNLHSDAQLALFEAAFRDSREPGDEPGILRRLVFGPAEQALLCQVALSLQLEQGDPEGTGAPDWRHSGLQLPKDIYRACLSSLRNQEAMQGRLTDNVLLTTAARRVGIDYTHMFCLQEAPYQLALALPKHKAAVELDGPWALAPDGSLALSTRLRRRHLGVLGWAVVPITRDQWVDAMGDGPGRSRLLEEMLVGIEASFA